MYWNFQIWVGHQHIAKVATYKEYECDIETGIDHSTVGDYDMNFQYINLDECRNYPVIHAIKDGLIYFLGSLRLVFFFGLSTYGSLKT